jgi:hypothetical protein
VVADFVWKGGNTGFPITAPPAIKRGEFVLCATPVIMRYLNTQFGWDPASPGAPPRLPLKSSGRAAAPPAPAACLPEAAPA